jgi:hypothetical protein
VASGMGVVVQQLKGGLFESDTERHSEGSFFFFSLDQREGGYEQ